MLVTSPTETPFPTRVSGVVFCCTCRFVFHHKPFCSNTSYFFTTRYTYIYSPWLFKITWVTASPRPVCRCAEMHCLTSLLSFFPPMVPERWKSASDFSVTRKSNCQPCYRISFSSWAYCNGKSKFVLKYPLLCRESAFFSKIVWELMILTSAVWIVADQTWLPNVTC